MKNFRLKRGHALCSARLISFAIASVIIITSLSGCSDKKANVSPAPEVKRNTVLIEEPVTPLNDGRVMSINVEETKIASNGTIVHQTEADFYVIPDRYNTGCKGQLTEVLPGDKINGVVFAENNNAVALDFAYKNRNVSGKITFENCDFSNQTVKLLNEDAVDRKIELVFKNCRFGTFRNSFKAGNITLSFESCTIKSFYGSSAKFSKCSFGHTYNDALNVFQNVLVEDCYFSDMALVSTTGTEIHTDGVQIYGNKDAEVNNILFNRCRFELPSIKTGSSNYVNACLMVQLEYSGANDLHFKNCIINGGGYSIYAHAKNKSLTLRDVTFENIKVGGAKLFGNVYPTVSAGVKIDSVNDQDSLYVSSVWKDSKGTHIITTNDTRSERVLRVVTDKKVRDYAISSCVGGEELRTASKRMDFETFPFDIDICIPEDVEYVVCYDVTGGNERQIRFVPFTSAVVYKHESEIKKEEAVVEETHFLDNVLNVQSNVSRGLKLFSADTEKSEETKSKSLSISGESGDIIKEGTCGKNVKYSIDGRGVLRIFGTGAISNYNSISVAPWLEKASDITAIVVEEGVTKIGSQAFRNLTLVNEVSLPKTLESIGKNAFFNCNSLTAISLYNSVTNVGERAFQGTKLKQVSFYGNIEEWEAITKGAYNDKLTSAVVSYESEELYGVVETGKCGANISFELRDNGELFIYGSGKMYNYSSTNAAPWYKFISSITKLTVDEGITGIGKQSFRNATELTYVQLPSSVEVIGANAFIGCKKLESVELGSKLKTIEQYAFNGTSLKDVIYHGDEAGWNKVSVGNYNGSIKTKVRFTK